jgi:anaerobic dimethyl sulfoxide reductase subunit B
MQMGFYFDQTRCTGCLACIVACKDWNDVPAGPASWRRVSTIEKGKYPDLFVAFYSSACYHCSYPTCINACPVGVITKREAEGVVIVDREKCLGKDNCTKCLTACPYKAPQFSAEKNAKMQKCDYCLARLAEGKKPACVDSCPMRAMDSGTMEDLTRKYGNPGDAEGFSYKGKLGPSIVIKPKNDVKKHVPARTETVPGDFK